MKNYDNENYVIQGTHVPWEKHSTVILLKEYEKYIYGNVLDIGCNTGGITYWLGNNDKVTSITGVDINPKVKDEFEKNLSAINIPSKFVCANLTETKIDDIQYDTAISFHIIEHIFPEHIDSFISNSTAGLKRGGNLIISIPYMKEYVDEHHREFYDVEKLRNVLERNNFETVECSHVESDPRWRERHLVNGIFTKK